MTADDHLQGGNGVDTSLQVADQQQPAENRAPDLNPRTAIDGPVAPRKPRRRRLTGHNVRKAQAALAAIQGTRHMDRRTWQAQYLQRVESEFTTAMGGSEVVSPQQAVLVRMAARTALLLEIVDSYIHDPNLLTSPINRGKRALFPIVVQRQSLATGLLDQLRAIGLERRAKSVPSIHEYLAAKTTPAVEAQS